MQKEKRMKSKTLTRIIALAFFAVLVLPLVSSAQEQKKEHHHYKLIDLGTFGGPNSGVNFEPFQNVINNAGTVVGGADTSVPTPEPNCYNPFGNPDCFISHGFVWRGNSLKDLGTLPGGNFSFVTAINQRGQFAGLSENDKIDPVSGNPEFHAVLDQVTFSAPAAAGSAPVSASTPLGLNPHLASAEKTFSTDSRRRVNR
jgi:hypothetical protein